jgi:hypothetical protein
VLTNGQKFLNFRYKTTVMHYICLFYTSFFQKCYPVFLLHPASILYLYAKNHSSICLIIRRTGNLE